MWLEDASDSLILTIKWYDYEFVICSLLCGQLCYKKSLWKIATYYFVGFDTKFASVTTLMPLKMLMTCNRHLPKLPLSCSMTILSKNLLGKMTKQMNTSWEKLNMITAPKKKCFPSNKKFVTNWNRIRWHRAVSCHNSYPIS